MIYGLIWIRYPRLSLVSVAVSMLYEALLFFCWVSFSAFTLIWTAGVLTGHLQLLLVSIYVTFFHLSHYKHLLVYSYFYCYFLLFAIFWMISSLVFITLLFLAQVFLMTCLSQMSKTINICMYISFVFFSLLLQVLSVAEVLTL